MPDMLRYVRESNLIEGVDDRTADVVALAAWHWLREQHMLTTFVVQQLHQVVMCGTVFAYDGVTYDDSDWVGELRTHLVSVGDHVAPKPTEVRRLLTTWCERVNESVPGGASQSGRLRSIDPRTLHVEFERIHPFSDGNGRTGRLLMWWHEDRRGVEPTLLLASQRHEYYRWFG